MTESWITAISSMAMAAIVTTFGPYSGASIIAIVAALSRLAYSREKVTLLLFGRFFAMSLSITMIMVHLGKLEGWENELVIVVSGVAAFLAREVLEVIVGSKDKLIKLFTGMLK